MKPLTPIFPSSNADLGYLSSPEVEARVQLKLDQGDSDPAQMTKNIEHGFGFDTDELQFIAKRARVSNKVRNVLSRFYPGWDTSKN
jgi:hypothetical protein